MCPNRYFLCVTRADVISTEKDLSGTGLTEPINVPPQHQPAVMEDAGENLLLIEEPGSSSAPPPPPHVAPPPPGQETYGGQPQPHTSIASELTSKNN